MQGTYDILSTREITPVVRAACLCHRISVGIMNCGVSYHTKGEYEWITCFRRDSAHIYSESQGVYNRAWKGQISYRGKKIWIKKRNLLRYTTKGRISNVVKGGSVSKITPQQVTICDLPINAVRLSAHEIFNNYALSCKRNNNTIPYLSRDIRSHPLVYLSFLQRESGSEAAFACKLRLRLPCQSSSQARWRRRTSTLRAIF